jgi:hypothetical protein
MAKRDHRDDHRHDRRRRHHGVDHDSAGSRRSVAAAPRRRMARARSAARVPARRSRMVVPSRPVVRWARRTGEGLDRGEVLRRGIRGAYEASHLSARWAWGPVRACRAAARAALAGSMALTLPGRPARLGRERASAGRLRLLRSSRRLQGPLLRSGRDGEPRPFKCRPACPCGAAPRTTPKSSQTLPARSRAPADTAARAGWLRPIPPAPAQEPPLVGRSTPELEPSTLPPPASPFAGAARATRALAD